MNRTRISKFLVFVLSLGLTFSTFQALPEDIDLFTVDEGNIVNHPNVLIVLDNSSNWSKASQKWPNEPTQGQAEVRAIKDAINGLDENVNVGLMEYVTGGSAADTDSGFVRFHIRPMNATNRAALSAILDTIDNNINDPAEKRSQGNPFGTLFWDVYNYLSGGDHSNGGTGTPSSADTAAYTSLYSHFRSPLTTLDNCTQTTIVFIANNVQGGPTGDGSTNVNALSSLGGVTTPQIKFRDFSCAATAATTDLGYSTSCYGTQGACSTAENNQACLDNGFTSCDCSSDAPVSCSSQHHFSGTGTTTTTTQTIVSGPTTVGPTANQPTGETPLTCKTAGQVPAYSCPTASDVTTPNTPVAGQSTRKQTSWSSCAYVQNGSTGCTGSKKNWEPRGTKTVITTVYQNTTSTTTTALPGETAGCYDTAASCSTTSFTGCPGGPGTTIYTSCACDSAGSASGCSSTTNRYKVVGHSTNNVCTAGNTFSTPPTKGGLNFMSDEWSRFLSQTGVLLPGGTRAQVKTHTIDVFNAQQDATQSSLLFSIARVSGGDYYQAKNKNDIDAALDAIFSEVQAVNSAFASASLPINATNRTQNLNQVFLGVFKPGRTKQPLWFGNLKRFQLVKLGSSIELGDKNGNQAVDVNTGFLAACSESFWTTDTGQYWFFTTKDDPDALGTCTAGATDVHSDLPDGPFAEKGGAAEVLRKGNTTGTVDADGNYVLTGNRNIKTLSGGSLVNFVPPIAGLADPVVNFIRGEDTENDDLDTGTRSLTEPRSTIHGDVIHSRPLPVSYSDGTGVVIYYGANDGVLRAVKSETGQELWSFVAPDHYSKLQRLKDNSPLVQYFGDTAPGLQRRGYFFDGSSGLYQSANDSDIRIFTSMRRGGRKIYAFNVTNPTSPSYLWSKGCPNLTDDTGCDTGFTGIGQTWSVPNAAFIKGYPTAGAETPVIIMGGGYDACEDANSTSPSCSSSKGRIIYVLDAGTGAVVKAFDLSSVSGTRSIAADLAFLDSNNDSFVDQAYAVDTGGNFYRVDFTQPAGNADPSTWTVQRIAYTNGASRKFLFPPALVQVTSSIVYVAVGSGDREHPLASQYSYTTPVVNRAYVFKDNLTATVLPSTSLSTTLTAGFNLDGSDMLDKTAASENTCSSEKVLPNSTKKGWYLDLTANGTGEQTVTSAVIATGFVFFSTNRPTPDAVTTACTNNLGEARGYFLNLLNGAGAIGVTGACGVNVGDARRSDIFEGGGLPPSPVLATVPIDGQITTVIIGAVDKDPEDDGGKNSPISPGKLEPIIRAIRKPIYWYKSSGDN